MCVQCRMAFLIGWSPVRSKIGGLGTKKVQGRRMWVGMWEWTQNKKNLPSNVGTRERTFTVKET